MVRRSKRSSIPLRPPLLHSHNHTHLPQNHTTASTAEKMREEKVEERILKLSSKRNGKK
ncbi:SNARE associated protein [Sesbania bispinosa]|nr:SNARE associated protein [Sesbania bispinosa]